MIRLTVLLAATVIALTGCRQPMVNQQQGLFGNQVPSNASLPQVAVQGDTAQFGELAKQVQDLNSRLSQFNSDNDNLHTQVAALQQRLQNANNYNDQLKQQLSDSLVQLQQTQIEKQQVAQQAQSNGGPSTQFAGATIRANNGLMAKLNNVQLPGLNAWMDGDVIRIEAPTDRLFITGTYQVKPNEATTLSNLASVIRQNFPRQVVIVEAHWDGTPVQPATTSHHQLTATQSLAIIQLLVKSGLPHDQLLMMAMGSNRPRYNSPVQNGISPNRRIEIVIYPETFN